MSQDLVSRKLVIGLEKVDLLKLLGEPDSVLSTTSTQTSNAEVERLQYDITPCSEASEAHLDIVITENRVTESLKKKNVSGIFALLVEQ